LEAFDYAFEMVQQRVRLALTGKKHAVECLIAYTTVFIATLEGAVMISKLYEDATHMQRAIEHLTWYIDTMRQIP
jgi:hypothetical protein